MNTYTDTEINDWDVSSEQHVRNLVKEIPTFIKNPSIRVIDVGSNVGKFIELLQKEVHIENAILIEPVIELLNYSKKKFPKFIFLNKLISNSNEPLHLYVPRTKNLGISRVMKTHYEAADVKDLRVLDSVTLSSLLLEDYPSFNPDLIKIDAEGLDAEIVIELLTYVKCASKKPIIVFEAIPETDLSLIKNEYVSLGYYFYSDREDCYSRDVFIIPRDCK